MESWDLLEWKHSQSYTMATTCNKIASFPASQQVPATYIVVYTNRSIDNYLMHPLTISCG